MMLAVVLLVMMDRAIKATARKHLQPYQAHPPHQSRKAKVQPHLRNQKVLHNHSHRRRNQLNHLHLHQHQVPLIQLLLTITTITTTIIIRIIAVTTKIKIIQLRHKDKDNQLQAHLPLLLSIQLLCNHLRRTVHLQAIHSLQMLLKLHQDRILLVREI